MSVIHEGALKIITCIEKNSPESFFQVSASSDQNNSETLPKVSPHLDHPGISQQVSAPPKSNSSEISQQESAQYFSDDTETYPLVSASPDQNSSEISNQVSAPNSDKKSPGEEGNLMNPMRLLNSSRKYLDMIFLAYPKNKTKKENLKLRLPYKRCLGMPSQVYLKIKFLLIPLIQMMPKLI